jgi:sulfonate transport system permease protein
MSAPAASPRAFPRPIPRPARIAVALVAPALLLAWWQWEAGQGGSRGVAFASLSAVASAAREQVENGSLLADTLATLRRALLGLAIGSVLGLFTGLATGLSRWLDRLLSPLLQALRQVPMIGWLPLVALWSGTGEGSQIAVIATSAFFPMLLAAHAGISQIERRYLDVGALYGFGPFQRFRLILLPAALPLLLTGLTQALAFAWIAAIATEILLGAGAGLGVTMQVAETQQRLDLILVAIAVTAALGFLLNQIVRRLRNRLLHWQRSA